MSYPKDIIQNIPKETNPPLNWLEFIETPPKIWLNVVQTLVEIGISLRFDKKYFGRSHFRFVIFLLV